MAYFLSVNRIDADGKGRTPVWLDLPKARYDQIGAWITDIDFFKQNRNLALLVSSERDEILNLFESANKAVLQLPFPFDSGSPRSERLNLEANRGFLNYLSAARTYLDHTEHNLKRRFGKESNQVSRFKELAALQYDQHFAYRLISKLRNYAQHCGFPVGAGFHMASNEDGKTMAVTLQVRFDRKRFLMDRDVWGAKVRSELEGGEDPIEAVPLLLKHHDCVMRIARGVELAYSSELHTAMAELKQVILEHGDEEALCAIHRELGKVANSDGFLTTYTDEQFPVNVFPIIERDIPLDVTNQ